MSRETRRGAFTPRFRDGISRGIIEETSGAVLVFMAVMLAIFVGLAVMAVDVGKLYVVRADLQAAADAAALAGVSQLPDSVGVPSQAKLFADA